MTITPIKLIGQDIESVFDDLAQLRIRIFKDYPYLYNGSVAYEKQYLRTYIASEKSLLFAIYAAPVGCHKKKEMVGATTCLPLADETPEVREPFEKAGWDINTIFYFGESILQPELRGLGWGHRFFEEREKHAQNFGLYTTYCFCSVIRPDNHPLKPLAYKPLDEFWIKRGYQKTPSVQSQFEWLDIGDTVPTQKQMVYWMKNIDK